METIVNRIIEIDRDADDRLAAAQAEQRQILADAKAEAAKRRETKEQETDRQIRAEEARKKAELESKTNALLEAQRETIAQLDRTFAAQRGQLEDDLFRLVLGIPSEGRQT